MTLYASNALRLRHHPILESEERGPRDHVQVLFHGGYMFLRHPIAFFRTRCPCLLLFIRIIRDPFLIVRVFSRESPGGADWSMTGGFLSGMYMYSM